MKAERRVSLHDGGDILTKYMVTMVVSSAKSTVVAPVIAWEKSSMKWRRGLNPVPNLGDTRRNNEGVSCHVTYSCFLGTMCQVRLNLVNHMGGNTQGMYSF